MPKAASQALQTTAFHPTLLLYYILPLSTVLTMPLLLQDDAVTFLIWWFVILAFGLAAFPLVTTIFSSFRGKGYGFSKAFGILAASLFVWTFCYIQLIGFTIFWLCISLFLLAGISWGLPKTRKSALQALSTESDVSAIAWSETLFIAALALMCFLRGHFPNINGEEKFMDFAFLNTLVRSDTLPCADPWFAGESINYYYYGQYIYAFITKFSGIKTSIAYNLSMCTTFAFTFSMAYSLGSMFIEKAMEKLGKGRGALCLLCGLISAFAVTIFGNSHSFFYDSDSFGNKFLYFLDKIGVNVGKYKEGDYSFFYPDSTRFIGYNPDVKVVDASTGATIVNGDYTIHEYPFYSYILGDLHAHVVSVMIVMLIIAVFFALYSRAKSPENEEASIRSYIKPIPTTFLKSSVKFEMKHLVQMEVVLAGILLGLATMCNYWDFLIYFIFGSMALLLYNLKTSRHFGFPYGMIVFALNMGLILSAYLAFSQKAFAHVLVQCIVFVCCLFLTAVFPNALSRTSLGMSFIFTLSSITSLTFNANFDMISNTLALVESHTALYSFIILWGVHLFAAGCLLIVTIRNVDKADHSRYVYKNKISAFFANRNPADVFVCGMAVVSFLLLLAPEIFYVRDIYQGDYKRTNTMFKFTFAAFILLALVMGYTVIRLAIRAKGKIFLRVISIFLIVLLMIPAYYPLVATKQRFSDISTDTYKTLDGTIYLTDLTTSPGTIKSRYGDSSYTFSAGELRPYYDGIEWLNDNVSGLVNICESYGLSYTDNCIVSANTGLPTILGWQTHEWLWRFHGVVDKSTGLLVNDPTKPDIWADILNPRYSDVDSIYLGTDVTAIKSILAEYDVTYLILGDIERFMYPDMQESVLTSCGTIVFQSDDFYIIQVA